MQDAQMGALDMVAYVILTETRSKVKQDQSHVRVKRTVTWQR